MGSSASPSDGTLPLGRRIQAYRNEQHKRRRDLAAAAGISMHRLANIETERTPAYASEVVALAAALEIPVGYLLEEAPIA